MTGTDSLLDTIRHFVVSQTRYIFRNVVHASLEVKICIPSISIAYTGLLLFYTHGQLMYGGDYPGVYNLYDVLSSPTPYVAFQGFALALGGGNVYVGFYISLVASTLGCIAGIYLTCKEVLITTFSEADSRFFAILGAGLYLISPVAITDSYLSVVANVSIPTLGTILFLFEYVKLWKSITKQSHFGIRNAVWMGVGLAISFQLLPTNIRILFVAVALLAFALVAMAVMSRSVTSVLRSLRRAWPTVAAGILSTILVGSYTIALTLIAFPDLFQTISSSAHLHASLGFYTGPFNVLPNSVRLLGTWGFPAVPYSSLYYEITYAGIAAYVWPILALSAPLVLWTRDSGKLILPFLIISAIIIFWDKGANPPFGGLWTAAGSILPGGFDFIPTFFLTSLILSKLYVVLTTFSIGTLHSKVREHLGRSQKLHRFSITRRGAASSITLALIVVIALSVMPLWTGGAETDMWNHGTTRGVYTIPTAYSESREKLVDTTGNVLLLPGVENYVQTSWGYYGSSAFYNEFYLPVAVITPVSFGGTYASNVSLEMYSELVHPLTTGNQTATLNSSWINIAISLEIRFLLIDYSMLSGNLTGNTYVNRTIAELVASDLVVGTLYKSAELAIYLLASGPR